MLNLDLFSGTIKTLDDLENEIENGITREILVNDIDIETSDIDFDDEFDEELLNSSSVTFEDEFDAEQPSNQSEVVLNHSGDSDDLDNSDEEELYTSEIDVEDLSPEELEELYGYTDSEDDSDEDDSDEEGSDEEGDTETVIEMETAIVQPVIEENRQATDDENDEEYLYTTEIDPEELDPDDLEDIEGYNNTKYSEDVDLEDLSDEELEEYGIDSAESGESYTAEEPVMETNVTQTYNNEVDELEQLKKQLEIERLKAELLEAQLKAKQLGEKVNEKKENVVSIKSVVDNDTDGNVGNNTTFSSEITEDKRLSIDNDIEIKSTTPNYDSMTENTLYDYVEDYMISRGVRQALINVKELEDEFGKNNIKKLMRKGYLVVFGKKATIAAKEKR